MSRDIRSFFTVKASPINQKKTSNIKGDKFGQKKRAAIVISDSDSDEESHNISAKRNKLETDGKKINGIRKKEESKVASKYFNAKNIDVSDIFGARPVKRDNSRNIIKKTVEKEDKECHFDKDFESELLQLDDFGSELETKTTNQDDKGSRVKESPEKVENNNSKVLEKTTKSEQSEYDPDYNGLPSKRIKVEENKKQSLPKSKEKYSMKTSPDSAEISSTKSSPQRSSPRKSPYKQSPLKNFFHSGSPSKNDPCKKSPTIDTKSSITTVVNKINKHVHSPKELVSSMEAVSPTVKYSPLKNNSIIPIKEKQINSHTGEIKNTPNEPCSLWVEKYKPSTTKQIIGQQGDKSCVKKLLHWLVNWHKNHTGNNKLVKPSPWSKNDDGAYFKAALLSGPPGVGKTTTAHLVANELGFDMVEFNASDTRSKKLLHQEVSELLSTNSLSPFFTGKGDQVTKKHVLLMDEVDGMAGNEDRGGVQELILLIKQSRVPIICMCNDRNHPKIRSLANYCFDLRFSKPRADQIRGAMLSMCFKEKLKVKPDALTEIITSANQDIRLIINHLSMLAIENTDLAKSTKYIKMGPWDILRKIFSEEEHKSMSIYDKCDLFFHDYSVTPLFVQENYLNVVPHKQDAKNKIKKMQLFASAAKSLSLGDLTERSIRSHNAWSLLPVQAVFSSLVPGAILEGHIGAQINFPAWFGKNSRQSKMSRLLQELTVHSRLKISGNKEAMNLDYLMPLEESIVSPLAKKGLDGISEALAVLSEYCLVREDLENISELSSWPNTKNQFASVDSKVKAAFTRTYNKTCAPTPYTVVSIKKGSRSDVENTDMIPEDENDVVQEEEDEEDDEADAMIVVKKRPSTKKVYKEAIPSSSKGNKNAKRGRKK